MANKRNLSQEEIDALFSGVSALLLVFGAKQARHAETRQRGLLMIACGVVFVANVLIWTV